MPRIANFGCEYQRIVAPQGSEAVNVDVRDNVGADVVCNLADPLPFPNNHFDQIHASHILEHFPYYRTVGILKEWRRVLIPHGKLIIIVPSFEYIFEMYQKSKVIHRPLIFGAQKHIGDVHLNVFDYSSLNGELISAGFDNIKTTFQNYELHSECFKPEG